MKKVWVILLSGVSSSGKTTLARALQKLLSTPERPFLHMEADDLLPHLPNPWPPKNTEAIKSLSRALRNAINAFAEEGFDLIVDGILPYGDFEGIKESLNLFGRHKLCYVGVHCSLEELERREQNKRDRTKGWAAKQFKDLHDRANYDIEVDTTATKAIDNANLIKDYLIYKNPNLNELF